MYLRGRQWWVRYHRDGRVFRRSLKTSNKKIAEESRFDLELALRRGAFTAAEPPARRPLVPLADFVKEYGEYAKSIKRPKTVATDAGRIADFTKSLGAGAVTDVTTGHVSRFLAKKSNVDQVSSTTILRYRETLHALFAHAKRLDYIVENPVAAIPRPRLPDRDVSFLKVEEIDDLLEAVADDLIAPLVATLVFAGLRREEACWLAWTDLDLASDRPCLRVRAKTVDEESWLPKTKRNRTVPISSRLLSILRGLPHRHATWLFPSPEGCRWNPDNLSARFRGLMEASDHTWNFLDLRHTFGSQLARKGVSLLKIAQLMGNSPEIARRHYIRLMPEEMQQDVEFSTTNPSKAISTKANVHDDRATTPPQVAA
jgi:integrase